MALTTQERFDLHGSFMRHGQCPGGITKADLLAAVGAADDWADLNAAAYNLALPVAFRTAASAQQKAVLLAYVILRRTGALSLIL